MKRAPSTATSATASASARPLAAQSSIGSRNSSALLTASSARPTHTRAIPAPAPQFAAARDHIKMAPSSTSRSTSRSTSSRAADADTIAPHIASASVSTIKSQRTTALKRKVDDVFKRMQPHTIVQSYDKLLAMLQIVPQLSVNNEAIAPLAAAPLSLTAAFNATQQQQRPSPSTSRSAAFDPARGRFHYAHSLQFAPPATTRTLAAIQTLDVTLLTAMRGTSSPIALQLMPSLTTKHWRFVAEATTTSTTKQQSRQQSKSLGLALYELPLGPWQSSAVVALVWTPRLELAQLFLQLSVAEQLFVASVERPIAMPCDDVDALHGLRAYVVAVTIRSFDRVLWEREVYDVAFALSTTSSTTPSHATVALLDDVNSVYRDRTRYLSVTAALTVLADALAVTIDTALAVDVVLWESSTCAPVWGFSRVLALEQQTDSTHRDTTDFALSGAERTQRLGMRHVDAKRGNAVAIALETIASSSNDKTTPRVFVKQVELTLSLRFIDATFGTAHAGGAKAKQ